MVEIAQFLPQGLDPQVALGLVAVSLFASLITAALSLGGGILMLSVLSLVFPPAIVIPVLGVVQLGSNAGRAFVQRAHIQWPLVLWMSLGAVLGVALGINVATSLPEAVFRALVGLFVLVTIWLPRPTMRPRGPVESFFGGAVIAFLSMIVGVTGPLVLTFLRAIGNRFQLVATHAALMSFQNVAKIAAFMLYGFAFASYMPLMLGMVVSGLVGTLIGSWFLGALPEKVFRAVFKVVVTLIALDLIRRALFG